VPGGFNFSTFAENHAYLMSKQMVESLKRPFKLLQLFQLFKLDMHSDRVQNAGLGWAKD
jgi:hypothetical protein